MPDSRRGVAESRPVTSVRQHQEEEEGGGDHFEDDREHWGSPGRGGLLLQGTTPRSTALHGVSTDAFCSTWCFDVVVYGTGFSSRYTRVTKTRDTIARVFLQVGNHLDGAFQAAHICAR